MTNTDKQKIAMLKRFDRKEAAKELKKLRAKR